MCRAGFSDVSYKVRDNGARLGRAGTEKALTSPCSQAFKLKSYLWKIIYADIFEFQFCVSFHSVMHNCSFN